MKNREIYVWSFQGDILLKGLRDLFPGERPHENPMGTPTQKFQMGPPPHIYIAIHRIKKETKIFGAKRKLINCPVRKLFRIKVRKKPIFTPWYASKIFFFLFFQTIHCIENSIWNFWVEVSLGHSLGGDNFPNPLEGIVPRNDQTRISQIFIILSFPKYREWIYRLYKPCIRLHVLPSLYIIPSVNKFSW